MTKKLVITGLISLWTCLAFAQDNNKKYWLYISDPILKNKTCVATNHQTSKNIETVVSNGDYG